MRQAVELVLAGRGTGERDLIRTVLLGEERALKRTHLIGHSRLEHGVGALRNAVTPERDVVWPAGLVVERDHVAGLDRQLRGLELILAAVELHAHVVIRA